MSRAEDLALFKNILDEYAALVNAEDFSRLASWWTDDVIAMPPNEPMLAGREALRAWHQNLADQFIVKTAFTPDEIEILGAWAYVRFSAMATLIPKAGGERVEWRLTEVTLFKQGPDGSWKLHRGIWNTPLPAKSA
ncbi:MAG: YybH family protein [Bryobacteraceae bacterium]